MPVELGEHPTLVEQTGAELLADIIGEVAPRIHVGTLDTNAFVREHRSEVQLEFIRRVIQREWRWNGNQEARGSPVVPGK